MEILPKEIPSYVYELLPGLLAAWIFYGLTAHQKPSTFERIVQALIFTLIVKILSIASREALYFLGRYCVAGTWTQDSQLITSTAIAVLLGTGLSWCANEDVLHATFRRVGMTRRTSFPSEWYGAFSGNPCWVVLHLVDERRLHGWPFVWPDQPQQGHFVIQNPGWLDQEGKRQESESTELILLSVSQVKMVEFLRFEKEPVG